MDNLTDVSDMYFYDSGEETQQTPVQDWMANQEFKLTTFLNLTCIQIEIFQLSTELIIH